jgi:hypothetical protein
VIAHDDGCSRIPSTRCQLEIKECVFLGEKRIPEPTLTTERWFLSVYYPYPKSDGSTKPMLCTADTSVKQLL